MNVHAFLMQTTILYSVDGMPPLLRCYSPEYWSVVTLHSAELV